MKLNLIAIVIVAGLIGGAFYFSSKRTQNIIPIVQNNTEDIDTPTNNNVAIVNGKQIIEIHAKGGYQPRKTIAKAGIPTVVRFDTNGTFDCSSALRIPSMNISQILPASGVTDVELSEPKIGILYGTCGMGMYPFEIDFQV